MAILLLSEVCTESMKLNDKIIKLTLKFSIIVNILTYIYSGISFLFLKHLPFHFQQLNNKGIIILIIEIVIILIGYLMVLYYKVFTALTNELFGLIVIWPIAGVTLMLLRIENNFILFAIFILGGGSIFTSILKMWRTKNISGENVFITPKSEKIS